MDIYWIVWVKAWPFFMSCKTFSRFSLVVDNKRILPNYYKIPYTPFFKKKTNKRMLFPNLPPSSPFPMATRASKSVPFKPYWSSFLAASAFSGTLSKHSWRTHARFLILLCPRTRAQTQCYYIVQSKAMEPEITLTRLKFPHIFLTLKMSSSSGDWQCKPTKEMRTQ